MQFMNASLILSLAGDNEFSLRGAGGQRFGGNQSVFQAGGQYKRMVMRKRAKPLAPSTGQALTAATR